jgi:hypothetical protein
MGPRSAERGYEAERLERERAELASMGPRSAERGYVVRATSELPKSQERFRERSAALGAFDSHNMLWH